jgi:hypothetical protein
MAAVKGKGLMEQVCALHQQNHRQTFNAILLYRIFIALFSSHFQDLTTLDVNTLTPLSPEVISRQATINIGKL